MFADVRKRPAHSCFHHVQDDHELSAEHDGQGDPGPLVTGGPRPPVAGDPGPPAMRTVPVNPVDLSGIVSPMRSMRRRQDASMVIWHRFLAGRQRPSMPTAAPAAIDVGHAGWLVPSRSGRPGGDGAPMRFWQASGG